MGVGDHTKIRPGGTLNLISTLLLFYNGIDMPYSALISRDLIFAVFAACTKIVQRRSIELHVKIGEGG